MILFPVMQLEIKTTLSGCDVESILRNEMGKKLNGYNGEIQHSKFELGSSRYLKVPISIVYGKIINQASGSILSASIRPSCIPFIFPTISLLMALSRITRDLSQSLQFFLLSIALTGLFMIGYKYSAKKDIEFINALFINQKGKDICQTNKN